MTPFRIAKIIYFEQTASSHQQRVPETDLIMNEAEAVAAFASTNASDGMMSSLYQYASEQIAGALPNKGTVVDLGCGSGALLIGLAELFPELEFIGVDLSDEMLKTAQERVSERNLKNISLIKENFTAIRSLKDHSVDFVFSSVALHHLSTTDELRAVANEVDRILTPEGGLYLIDFARLRTNEALRMFVDDAVPVAPALLVRDYEASLKAAFSVEEWRDAFQVLNKRRLSLTTMIGAQFMQCATILHPRRREQIPPILSAKWRRLELRYMLDYLSLRFLMRGL